MIKTLKPSNKKELQELIEIETNTHWHDCDLNHIDVSDITDMIELFINSIFNGNISKWDTSQILNMNYTFHSSLFNQDISDWNIKKLKTMTDTFKHSLTFPYWSEYETQKERICAYNKHHLDKKLNNELHTDNSASNKHKI